MSFFLFVIKVKSEIVEAERELKKLIGSVNIMVVNFYSSPYAFDLKFSLYNLP